ncbi:DUF3515 family protein [Pseudokineococcus basanitobsidens]|uniref:DUF3515 family protein n=1 Tax=Pseudokineococcus basanitobsidens TaxID=1926649 RepID=A0ABU8RK69_9ACTN
MSLRHPAHRRAHRPAHRRAHRPAHRRAHRPAHRRAHRPAHRRAHRPAHRRAHRRAHRPARLRAVAAVLTAVGLTSGCTASVREVPPADQAADPGCAQVLVLLRDVDEVAGLPRVPTTGQSTAAWAAEDGSAEVVLRCGVALPGPTTDACLAVDGVDWVASDEEASPPWTTYGRVPATEVDASGDLLAADVLPTVGGAVSGLEQQRACA